MEKYDIVFIRKLPTEDLSAQDYTTLYNLLQTDIGFPLEVESPDHQSIAYGLISDSAADYLEYDYDRIRQMIAPILEHSDAKDIYTLDILRIKLLPLTHRKTGEL